MREVRAMERAAALCLSVCVALASCGDPSGAGPDGPPSNGEPEGADAALMGDWLLLQINRNGEDIDLDNLEGAIRHIGSSNYSIKPMSGTTITGRYTVDPTADPRTIEMMVDNGRFEGGTLKGIYRVEDDRLTISFGTPGEPRPAAFDSAPGTQHTVAVHKRVE